MASNRAELAALKKMIAEADLTLETIPTLPENSTARCRELLKFQWRRRSRRHGHSRCR
jgi:RecB family exonuclease